MPHPLEHLGPWLQPLCSLPVTLLEAAAVWAPQHGLQLSKVIGPLLQGFPELTPTAARLT